MPVSQDLKVDRIVMATDLSESSLRASLLAQSLAKLAQADLSFVHVLSVPLPPLAEPAVGSVGLYEQLEKDARAHAETVLSGLAEKASARGVKATTEILNGGPVDEEIVRFAEENRADLIVVGTHGRTGVSKFFLGSVAARVIANASCPVITARGT